MKFDLLNYIELSEEITKKLTDLAEKDEVSILRLSEDFFSGKTNCLLSKKPIMKLAVILKAAEKTHLLYQKKGIDEKIFAQTFDDIRIWCENCEEKGIENHNWLKNHICFELFKIGRLQYQLFCCSNPFLHYSRLPVSKNERVIYIHIPQGEKLDIDDCRASLAASFYFFREYFPDYKFRYYFCESWLLFENNREFMENNSNIVKFMDLFDIHYSVFEERQAFERIFNCKNICKYNFFKRKSNVKQLPELTSLQKNAKKYLLSGKKLGFGIGTIPKEKFADKL